MGRPKTDLKYDADDQTIVAYFDQSMEAMLAQKAESAKITDLNVQMQEDGVSPLALSLARRFARMKPGRRGKELAMLHRVFQVLASRLEDPLAPQESAVPFERKTAA